MKQRLRAVYLAISEKYPAIGSIMWRLYHRRIINKVRRKIKGKENVVNYKGSILSSVVFDIVGQGNKIEIMKSCFLKSVTFYIRGNNHSIYIGEKCRFNQGGNLWLVDSGGRLEIGDRSTFENVHLAVTEPGSAITIGQDCMFAYDIDVRTGDSHSIVDRSNNERINYAEDVSIGNHVWVAAHCCILKGVNIADDSVVATGSIVTKKFFENGVIIAGNPARVVKEGINWSGERI